MKQKTLDKELEGVYRAHEPTAIWSSSDTNKIRDRKATLLYYGEYHDVEVVAECEEAFSLSLMDESSNRRYSSMGLKLNVLHELNPTTIESEDVDMQNVESFVNPLAYKDAVESISNAQDTLESFVNPLAMEDTFESFPNAQDSVESFVNPLAIQDAVKVVVEEEDEIGDSLLFMRQRLRHVHRPSIHIKG